MKGTRAPWARGMISHVCGYDRIIIEGKETKTTIQFHSSDRQTKTTNSQSAIWKVGQLRVIGLGRDQPATAREYMDLGHTIKATHVELDFVNSHFWQLCSGALPSIGGIKATHWINLIAYSRKTSIRISTDPAERREKRVPKRILIDTMSFSNGHHH